MPGAMRESCPLGREGSLGCHVVPYISLAMEKQLSPERVVLCIQYSERFLYLSAGVAVTGTIGWHVSFLPPPQEKELTCHHPKWQCKDIRPGHGWQANVHIGLNGLLRSMFCSAEA